MHEAIERVEPRTPAEAVSFMRDLGVTSKVAFVGGGTHTIGTPAADAIRLSTRGLRRIVEYTPQDQTVTVEAGVTVAELTAVLAAEGQRLVAEVSDPQRATIGGIIAANVYGPRRLRFGSLKDLILGVAFVRADGTPARAGGKVVKNVAGFDLSKLVVGSHGTLVLITAATLRVHPLPQVTAAVRIVELPPKRVWELVLALREQQLEPAAVVAASRADGSRNYDCDLVFEGFRSGVEAQLDTVRTLARNRGWVVADIAPEAAQSADAQVRAAEPLRLRCVTAPATFATTDADVIESLLRTLGQAAANAYPSLGVWTLGGTPTPATAPAVRAARAQIEHSGGSLVVEAQPPAGNDWDAIEPWGTPPASFGLMHAIKSRFDPAGRLSPGRFVGGL